VLDDSVMTNSTYVVMSYSWSQNEITVRVSRIRVRIWARVSAMVRFRLIRPILLGQCQIWLLLH